MILSFKITPSATCHINFRRRITKQWQNRFQDRDKEREKKREKRTKCSLFDPSPTFGPLVSFHLVNLYLYIMREQWQADSYHFRLATSWEESRPPRQTVYTANSWGSETGMRQWGKLRFGGCFCQTVNDDQNKYLSYNEVPTVKPAKTRTTWWGINFERKWEQMEWDN